MLNKRALISITILVTLVDQLTKLWAQNNLNYAASKVFIPETIQLRLVKNTGAAFSFLSGSTYLLGLFSFLVSIALITWIFRNAPLSTFKGIGCSFLLGGTLGNGIDRWLQGSVTDFIELTHINFPIFNIADIAINIAVICLLIENIYKKNGSRNF